PLREKMKKALNRLRYQGVDDILMLTGDLEQQASMVASRMSLDRFAAEQMPEDKAKTVMQLQSDGVRVVMVGDGIIVAAALAYADVGVALGGAKTDIAMEAADITIAGDNPMMLPATFELSQKTMGIIRQNFTAAITLNSLGLMLGGMGLLPVLGGAILHNASTILVVGNSLRILFHDMDKRR
ncbi:MAG: HAD-IC family P-type ATPase, partial [Lentisphaeraceae bacterium]|nr:HAD-IC family P-type ATPase [Lentisphaeraceae bacterium]